MKHKISFLLPVCLLLWITAHTQTTWTGNMSTNWNLAGNWTAGIPDATDDVTIPNAVKDPIIPSGTAAVAKSVKIQAGGALTIDPASSLTINGATTKGFDSEGTVNNSGLIRIGNTGSAGNIGFVNQSFFNNLSTGEISIDQSTAIGLLNTGTFNNLSKISIGSTFTVGGLGLENSGVFHNNSGEINVDRTANDAIYNYWLSTFTNSAKINVGTVGSIGGNGILNDGTFSNQTGGDILLNHCSFTCLYNYFNGTFNNAAKITIGTEANAAGNGIGNGNIFNNNAGGEIKIDNTLIGALNTSTGTFTNAAKITIGATAGVGEYGIENEAIFNNQTGSEINIDRSTTVGLNNAKGSFSNAAKITIGAIATTGTYGIKNLAIFNNQTNSEISIERAVSSALTNGQGTFINAAKITIGATVSGGSTGLFNGAIFHNNSGGDIAIDRTSGDALYNYYLSTFNNAAKITIGAVAGLGANGLLNDATFNNNSGGDIRIDRTTYVGLYNYFNGTFTNKAKITIGAAAANAGQKGIANASIFNNVADGDIKIDRATVRGLNNTGGTFTNAARITIGATLVGTAEYALGNDAVFNNQSCALLVLFAPVYNIATLTSSGLFYVNTLAPHTNTGLINNGILTFPQGNPIPNVTNNDFVLAPISGTGIIPNALQKGLALSFTAGSTWYLDPQQTIPGGTYNQAANTFTPVGGTGFRFFNISDNVNGCPRQLVIKVTINNGNPPVITCPANVVKSTDPGQCSAVVTYPTPTASCNCSPAPLVTHVSGGTSGSTFSKGATTVTWMATDASSNTATCSFTVTVNDTQAPTITCPANQTKNTEPNLCTATVTYATPVSTDNCPGVNATLQSGPASGAAFPKGQTTVIWRATDAAGGTKTCTFRVTVNDMQAPGISCPASQNLNADPGQCSAVATYAAPTADDNCAPQPTVIKVSGLSSGSTFPKGMHTIVWKATDGTGNTKTCSFSITVADNQLPVVTCPANIAVTAAPGACSATVSYSTPVATDNCALQSSYLLSGLASYSVFPQGVTTNVWKATDESGFTATCAFTVTVSCGTNSSSKFEVRSSKLGQRLADSTTLGLYLDLRLAPNPATTQVTVSMEGLDETGGELTVFDAAGRMVWQQQLTTTDSMVILDVSESKWAAGLYFVTLRSRDHVVTKRLTVSR